MMVTEALRRGKVIFHHAGATAEAQRAQGCHTARNITDDDNDDADSTDHLLWVRHYFFFSREVYIWALSF